MTSNTSTTTEAIQDEIISELRAIREAYAERFGFDIRAIYQEAKREEERGGREIVVREPRRIDDDAEGNPSDRRD
jgi:hypothetical protein